MVIDELAYFALPEDADLALIHVANLRYLKTSIVITTNRNGVAWGEILEDSTIAAARLSRLLRRLFGCGFR
ncbi:DNA replication protein DnaC [Arthrobacter stackebrandtii]|uniref:DNA replication protein DnaC n=2 Tax=Arthrobacter stackebrandtii TaxID=272161 RepID=A0ABS4YTQ0_9MICC|nr:DNA replication protein DnaC [Arthrobacter stackebrandtii]